SNFISQQGISNLSSSLINYNKLFVLKLYLRWNKIIEAHKSQFRNRLLKIKRLQTQSVPPPVKLKNEKQI
ncbi:hypothetical protein ABPG74_006698, partial [Tetrahymena malaccensis]